LLSARHLAAVDRRCELFAAGVPVEQVDEVCYALAVRTIAEVRELCFASPQRKRDDVVKP
jgi:hypothetical protein